MKTPARFQSGRACRLPAGFTLIEFLAAAAIFTVILTVIFGVTQQTGNAWRSTSAKTDAFQNARAAFELLTQNLGQATLNTYYDYYDAAGQPRNAANAASFVPASYGRASDLHFLTGKALLPQQVSHATFFQTPAGYSDDGGHAGMDTLLNACGYYVEFSQERERPAFFQTLPNPPPVRARYRLMQFLQPSRQLAIFDPYTTGRQWFTAALSSAAPPTRQVAENIIALVILPKTSAAETGAPLSSDYEYDSRAGSSRPQARTQHQLPPLVEIVLVAIDEASAKRLEQGPAAPDLGVGSLFSSAANLEADLKTLEATLNNRRITHRVFRTTVALRNAKWSS